LADEGEPVLKAYEELTPRGRERRLRHVAEAALERYELDVISFELVGRGTRPLSVIEIRPKTAKSRRHR
jgi:hypothetical protein